MEYAVRGPIPRRAAELRKQGMETIACNIGNPQALGQKPITFFRQVLSLIEEPARIGRERKINAFYKKKPGSFTNFEERDFVSDYVLDYAENILSRMDAGIGAYTDSSGPAFIKESVARYIDARDGVDSSRGKPANPDNVFLTDGASEAVRHVLELLITDERDGIMIPIPQYPLYSATIKKCGGTQVDYYPDEDAGWIFDRSVLEESLAAAEKKGVRVKAIVVINPGNPTGAVLDENSIKEMIEFAGEHGIIIIADEVYQENMYGTEFHSFAKVLGTGDVPLMSLHSISKGFYGECGHRGGYLEVRNAPRVEGTDVSFVDVINKQASVALCSNTVGQMLMYLMLNPPEPGSDPYRQYIGERQFILNELSEKATMIRNGFNEMDGVECFGRTGALYLFPRLNKLPKGTNDFDYCMNLLEATGLCTSCSKKSCRSG